MPFPTRTATGEEARGLALIPVPMHEKRGGGVPAKDAAETHTSESEFSGGTGSYRCFSFRSILPGDSGILLVYMHFIIGIDCELHLR
jgi:hypothetical protein